jgi:two-component system, chemotaxis family, protein-glutamate methylesterase/glutaminase
VRTPSDQGTTTPRRDCEAVVIGGSAGSTVVIEGILSQLPGDFPVPIFVVQHVHESDDGSFAEHLGRTCQLRVVVPCDKQPIEKGCVFVAPANYHMLLERGGTVALSVDGKVNWSRPSIDVLFDSAARAYGKKLVAIIVSGANDDGAEGMKTVKNYGGIAIVQSPGTAESPVMPQAAIEASNPDYVRKPSDIAKLLKQLMTVRQRGRSFND